MTCVFLLKYTEQVVKLVKSAGFQTDPGPVLWLSFSSYETRVSHMLNLFPRSLTHSVYLTRSSSA